jgi:hypothetical protein
MTLSGRHIAMALFTLATFALLLFTLGAPYEHGG